MRSSQKMLEVYLQGSVWKVELFNTLVEFIFSLKTNEMFKTKAQVTTNLLPRNPLYLLISYHFLFVCLFVLVENISYTVNVNNVFQTNTLQMCGYRFPTILTTPAV